MEVKQIYEIVNDSLKEVVGETTLLKEDLSNIVDMGDVVLNANALDNYIKSLVNHIGRVIVVNRVYKGGAPKVLMDAWEFGSVMEKISFELPEAQENESWELEDGTSYDVNIFYSPKASAKFWNKRTTFEVPISITERQVKESFSNATQLNAFISGIYTAVENKLTISLDNLIMRTINNMSALTIDDNNGARFVKLITMYNQATGTTITKARALTDANFLKFASYTIGLYVGRISKVSKLFNMGGKERFTPKDVLHVILLDNFAKASEVYLESDTYHKELVALPNYESVPYWQGSGVGYDLLDVSKINVTASSGASVEHNGIIAVMFDRNALGVSNLDKRVTTNYNAKAEFFNNYYKQDAGYFNDTNENFVVFTLD